MVGWVAVCQTTVTVVLPTASISSPQQGASEQTSTPTSDVATATSTFQLSFPLAQGTTFASLQASGKLTTFAATLRSAIANKTGVPESWVLITNLREGSIIAEVSVTAPADSVSQQLVTQALVSNPESLFDGTTALNKADFGITAVSGTMTSSTLLVDCSKPVQIGVGVGVGVGGAIGVAGLVTAYVVSHRSKQAVHIA